MFLRLWAPDGQPSTVRPQASFSLKARVFLSDVEPPPLSSLLLFQRARKYIENQDAPEIYAGPIANKEDSHAFDPEAWIRGTEAKKTSFNSPLNTRLGRTGW